MAAARFKLSGWAAWCGLTAAVSRVSKAMMLMLALLCDPGLVCAPRPRHSRARAPRSCHCPCAAVVVVLLLCWRRPGEDWWPGRGPCPQSICSSGITPPAASIFSTLHQISSSHQAQHPGMQTGSPDKIEHRQRCTIPWPYYHSLGGPSR